MSALSQARHVLMILTAASVAVAGLASPARSAIAGMRFSVRPDSSGSLSEGGDYFVVRTAPGKVVEEALEVSNPSSRPVEVLLAPVDGTTAQMGGVDYTPSTAPARAVGSWLELDETRVSLAPGEATTVPFSVTVPGDAPSGVNLGGIAAWTPAADEERANAEGAAATVEVQTRRVVAVQVELPGPAAPHLEIAGVSAVARPDGVYLQVDIENTGHGFAEGEGALELPGESFSSAFPLDKVVPGTSVGYPIKWRTGAPPDGAYPVKVSIDYGAGVAEYEGEVTVGERVRRDLADRGIGDAGNGSSSLLPLAGAGVLVLAAGVVVVVRRRKRRGAAAPPSPPAPASAGSRVAPPPPPPPPVAAAPPPPPPPVAAGRR